MPFTALTYDIKPGFEAELAEIFGSFRRTASPDITDESGAVAARILATAVFFRDPVLIRVIQYEGSLAAIKRHMAVQPGVREVERRLKPYLAAPRATDTPEGFARTFDAATMRCFAQMSVPDTAAVPGDAGAR
jgi:hypothetical protein